MMTRGKSEKSEWSKPQSNLRPPDHLFSEFSERFTRNLFHSSAINYMLKMNFGVDFIFKFVHKIRTRPHASGYF